MVSRDTQALAERARAELYGLFSGVFARELSPEVWARLCTGKAQASLRALAESCGVRPEIDALLDVLDEEAVAAQATAIEALAVDYARLFKGPGPGLAPPYESAYTGLSGRPYIDAPTHVAALLRVHRLANGRSFTGPADHIAVGLSVMQHFAEEAARQLSSGRPADALRKRFEFFERRLERWVPAWVVDVRAGASTAFYREIGGMLDEHLRRDAEWLRHAIGRAR